MNIYFKNDSIEPVYKSGYEILNPQVMTEKFSTSFNQEKTNNETCNSIAYTNLDPRLYSAARNQRLVLDNPPIQSKRNLNMINNDTSLNSYGKRYTDYQSINAGQIVYYLNNSTKGVDLTPVFTTPSYIHGYDYKDPMDSIKPQYVRTPLINTSKCNTGNKQGNLSFINDTTAHREDIMHYQMAVNNRQKYGARMY